MFTILKRVLWHLCIIKFTRHNNLLLWDSFCILVLIVFIFLYNWGNQAKAVFLRNRKKRGSACKIITIFLKMCKNQCRTPKCQPKKQADHHDYLEFSILVEIVFYQLSSDAKIFFKWFLLLWIVATRVTWHLSAFLQTSIKCISKVMIF